MHEGDGPLSPESLSLWSATASIPRERWAAEDATCDVCVVGAGIAGMTTAYLLARAGQTVIVLDDGPVASGQTQRTTAHLSAAIDDRYVEIERLHGADGARLAAQSHSSAIAQIEQIVRDEQIECDFARVDGYLFLGEGHSIAHLEEELAAVHRAGLTDVQLLRRHRYGSFELGPCLRFPRQGQFHPLKYLAGVAAAIQRDKGRIYTAAHVTRVDGTVPARVATEGGGTVYAKHVVIATNTPINDRVVIHTKQAPYLTYVIGLIVRRDAIAPALAWDTLDPYHYLRTQPLPDTPGKPARDVLIVGGEDHKTGQSGAPEACWERLELWARERFPEAREVAFRWSGQIMETIDGLAFIGRNPLCNENVYIATGDSGMGMTHGTIAGMLLSDLILGRDNPWTGLYEPSRRTLRAAATFARENLNVVRQYADWLSRDALDSSAALQPGQGAIVKRGLRKIAAYRDEDGRLHEFSAACRHLGCPVSWNGAESTWDCPCHGSRFDRFGRVINGPANSDLAPVDAETPGAPPKSVA